MAKTLMFVLFYCLELLAAMGCGALVSHIFYCYCYYNVVFNI